MIFTTDQIKRANADAGRHFFSPDTMRFFSSRLCQWTVIGEIDGVRVVFFCTTEKRCFDDYRRLACLRATINGVQIASIAHYPDSATAKRAALRFAKSHKIEQSDDFVAWRDALASDC